MNTIIEEQRVPGQADVAVRQALEAENRELHAALANLTEQYAIALADSQRQFRDFAEMLPAMAVEADLNAHITFANRRSAEQLGYPVEEMLGLSLYETVSADEQERVAAFVGRIVGGESVHGVRLRAMRRDGSTFTMLVDIAPILQDGQVTGIRSVAQPIDVYVRLEEEIRAYQHRLRDLSSHVLLAEENERQRMAQDLHDSVGQLLALTKVRVDALSERCGAQPGMREMFDSLGESLRSAIDQVRSLTFQLSPSSLHKVGLEAALEELCERMMAAHDIHIKLRVPEPPLPLRADVRVLLFRTVRELLSNVIRHARALTAFVEIDHDRESLEIVVEDDGIGFKEGREPPLGAGIGLFSIRERIDSLGGHVSIESLPGSGTNVHITLPMAAVLET